MGAAGGVACGTCQGTDRVPASCHPRCTVSCPDCPSAEDPQGTFLGTVSSNPLWVPAERTTGQACSPVSYETPGEPVEITEENPMPTRAVVQEEYQPGILRCERCYGAGAYSLTVDKTTPEGVPHAEVGDTVECDECLGRGFILDKAEIVMEDIRARVGRAPAVTLPEESVTKGKEACSELVKNIQEANKALDKADQIYRPAHYNTGNVECIAAIEASMSPAAFQGYCKGNSLKYLWRCSYKGKLEEDLEKAAWYLERMQESVRKALEATLQAANEREEAYREWLRAEAGKTSVNIPVVL